ncbi:MAG TPA: 2-phosphosulfolactate phosphatase [Bacillales bacterium]|nr:2-phosphosulfolactate phosphatase [Bacillales bacterium]
MGKAHVLMRKEEIDPQQIEGKVAVVFDVLLATSTITAALQKGATEVVPVLNEAEAHSEAAKRTEGSYLLSGEYGGLTLDGFISPSPLELQDRVAGKSLVLSTTNGTVAIKKAAAAKKVFAACLLNGEAVAEAIHRFYENETLVLVCSGSMERFCLEDFYGAGYFLDCLVGEGETKWELTDSARAALFFYRGNKADSAEMLGTARVGKMLSGFGKEEDMRYVARRGVYSVIPYFNGKTVVNGHFAETLKDS